MNDLIYHIPLHRLPDYRIGRLIVRASDPAALIAALSSADPERIVGVQLQSLDADSEPLNAWGLGLPVELSLAAPADFPKLYRHVNLLEAHPLRVAIPVVPGFAKAVKVALALNFAVRLELGQPEPAALEELAEVLEFYLRQSTVAQPIDYFQGALLGFYHQQAQPLWVILDEEPTLLRWVADDGVESLYGRLAGVAIPVIAEADLSVWIEQVLAAGEECQTCAFRQSCGGYFKWPRPDYPCAGVKRLFGALRDAADELRRDLEAAPT